MADFGTPHEGVDNILLNAYTSGGTVDGDLTLVLYTNTSNSLTRSSVYADLTQPDNAAEGYAVITLDGTWSANNSEISYVHSTPTNPIFTNNGGGDDWDAATGSAICDGAFVLHFKDFGNSITVTNGGTLEIDVSSITA